MIRYPTRRLEKNAPRLYNKVINPDGQRPPNWRVTTIKVIQRAQGPGMIMELPTHVFDPHVVLQTLQFLFKRLQCTPDDNQSAHQARQMASRSFNRIMPFILMSLVTSHAVECAHDPRPGIESRCRQKNATLSGTCARESSPRRLFADRFNEKTIFEERYAALLAESNQWRSGASDHEPLWCHCVCSSHLIARAGIVSRSCQVFKDSKLCVSALFFFFVFTATSAVQGSM